MNRQAYLRQHFDFQLEQHIANSNMRLPPTLVQSLAQQEPYACVDWLMSHDPSKNRRFSQWIIETFLRDGFLAEDGVKVRETLELFLANQQRLDVAQRDIGSYKTLADLWIIVKRFHQTEEEDFSLSGKMKKRNEMTKAHRESIILLDQNDITIAVPLTIEAAKWWGRGTRWCTAADKDNAFYSYHEDAPLIVIDLKKDGKFQLFVDRSDFQFTDANDSELSKATIKKHWKQFAPVLKWAIERNAYAFSMIPNNEKDYPLCLKAVTHYGATFLDTPPIHRDAQLCLEAVKNNGRMLPHLPEEHLTLETCMAAVKQDGTVLKNVPKKYRSRALCLEAVKQAGTALQYVPKKHLDRSLCLAAIRQNGEALRMVPSGHQDYALCLEAVQQNGSALEDVPVEFRDEIMCLEAVKETSDALSFVPAHLMNHELCLFAAQNSKQTSLVYIPPEFQTYDVCLVEVKKEGLQLSHVPAEIKDYSLCLEAVRNNGNALKAVPGIYLDLNICLEAAKRTNRALAYVPMEYFEEALQCYENANVAPSPVEADWLKDETLFDSMRAYINEEIFEATPLADIKMAI